MPMKAMLPSPLRSFLRQTKDRVCHSVAVAAGRYPGLNPDKKEAISQLWHQFKPRSFADLGGVWAVDGGYTFYALEKHEAERAFLVDTDFTPTVQRKRRPSPA